MTRVETRDLGMSFNGREVLRGIGLAIDPGHMVGLIGPNGAGKTTLLRIAAGLLRPSRGEVRFEGEALSAIAPRRRAQAISFLPTGAPCHWPIEVGRLVALGRLPHLAPWQTADERDVAAIDRALALAGARDFVGRSVATLSDGERARVMLARALAGEPRLLLADEPVAGLDPLHQLTVMETLAGLAAQGGSVIVTLHDLSLATRYCSRLVLLDAGAVVADGGPGDVLTKKNLAEIFGIEALEGNRDGISFILPWTPLNGDRNA